MAKFKRTLVSDVDAVSDQFVLNMADVAAILNVVQSKAGELCATGTIPGAFRVGRLLRIQAGDLRKYINGQKLPLNPHLNALRNRRGAS